MLQRIPAVFQECGHCMTHWPKRDKYAHQLRANHTLFISDTGEEVQRLTHDKPLTNETFGKSNLGFTYVRILSESTEHVAILPVPPWHFPALPASSADFSAKPAVLDKIRGRNIKSIPSNPACLDCLDIFTNLRLFTSTTRTTSFGDAANLETFTKLSQMPELKKASCWEHQCLRELWWVSVIWVEIGVSHGLCTSFALLTSFLRAGPLLVTACHLPQLGFNKT